MPDKESQKLETVSFEGSGNTTCSVGLRLIDAKFVNYNNQSHSPPPTHLSTLCQPDVIAHDEISQPFSLHFAYCKQYKLEPEKAWEWDYMLVRPTAAVKSGSGGLYVRAVPIYLLLECIYYRGL